MSGLFGQFGGSRGVGSGFSDGVSRFSRGNLSLVICGAHSFRTTEKTYHVLTPAWEMCQPSSKQIVVEGKPTIGIVLNRGKHG